MNKKEKERKLKKKLISKSEKNEQVNEIDMTLNEMKKEIVQSLNRIKNTIAEKVITDEA